MSISATRIDVGDDGPAAAAAVPAPAGGGSTAPRAASSSIAVVAAGDASTSTRRPSAAAAAPVPPSAPNLEDGHNEVHPHPAAPSVDITPILPKLRRDELVALRITRMEKYWPHLRFLKDRRRPGKSYRERNGERRPKKKKYRCEGGKTLVCELRKATGATPKKILFSLADGDDYVPGRDGEQYELLLTTGEGGGDSGGGVPQQPPGLAALLPLPVVQQLLGLGVQSLLRPQAFDPATHLLLQMLQQQQQHAQQQALVNQLLNVVEQHRRQEQQKQVQSQQNMILNLLHNVVLPLQLQLNANRQVQPMTPPSHPPSSLGPPASEQRRESGERAASPPPQRMGGGTSSSSLSSGGRNGDDDSVEEVDRHGDDGGGGGDGDDNGSGTGVLRNESRGDHDRCRVASDIVVHGNSDVVNAVEESGSGMDRDGDRRSGNRRRRREADGDEERDGVEAEEVHRHHRRTAAGAEAPVTGVDSDAQANRAPDEAMGLTDGGSCDPDWPFVIKLPVEGGSTDNRSTTALSFEEVRERVTSVLTSEAAKLHLDEVTNDKANELYATTVAGERYEVFIADGRCNEFNNILKKDASFMDWLNGTGQSLDSVRQCLLEELDRCVQMDPRLHELNQSRGGMHLRGSAYLRQVASLLISYGSVEAQSWHIDMQFPLYQAALLLTPGPLTDVAPVQNLLKLPLGPIPVKKSVDLLFQRLELPVDKAVKDDVIRAIGLNGRATDLATLYGLLFSSIGDKEKAHDEAKTRLLDDGGAGGRFFCSYGGFPGSMIHRGPSCGLPRVTLFASFGRKSDPNYDPGFQLTALSLYAFLSDLIVHEMNTTDAKVAFWNAGERLMMEERDRLSDFYQYSETEEFQRDPVDLSKISMGLLVAAAQVRQVQALLMKEQEKEEAEEHEHLAGKTVPMQWEIKINYKLAVSGDKDKFYKKYFVEPPPPESRPRKRRR